MKPFFFQFAAILLLLLNTIMILETQAAYVKPQRVTCYKRYRKCYLKYITCPSECPEIRPKDPYAKECFLDCYSPKCEAVCRSKNLQLIPTVTNVKQNLRSLAIFDLFWLQK